MADDLEVRVARLEERIKAQDRALELQASEYERRLDVLNHAHEEARKVAAETVTRDRFDTYVKTETESRDLALAQVEEKRVLALERVDEKFEDYVKRWEQRTRELQQAVDISKGAAGQAQRIAEEQGRKSNRNIGIATAAIVFVSVVANYLGAL